MYKRRQSLLPVGLHGSPHRFESFDLGAVGSGEGGQAHGWGLYFARDKKIAEGYRAKLESKGDGALFEVDVPENDVLLDEDKPLSEQPERVREAIAKYYNSRPDDYIATDKDHLGSPTGRAFLKDMMFQMRREGEEHPKKAVSLLLNSLGIKGITYDGSRDGRCFVVFDDKAISVINRYNQEAAKRSSLVREGLTRKPDSAQAKVVRLKNVPELAGKKVKEILAWAKSILQSGGDITIRSTGQVARFTTTNINASLKRSREKLHNEAYVVLREMVENAEYDHFEPGDVKHATRAIGQDVYYSALSIDEQLYSVRLKMDVVPEEIRQREKAAGMSPENIRYKDHKLTEIEIAPALYHGMPNNGVPMQEAGAISTVSLGVLRGNVKPSSYDGAHLSQERRGQIRIGSHGEGLVTLFKNADRSTFFHEMGHMMLDDLIADGLLEKANARTKADLDAVRAYLGIGDMDLSKRHTFDGAEKARYAEAQERFARSFEAYLMEGKSPTVKMRGVFARVRQWLIDIYHDLSRLNVELSPEVREVFDRLLATPDEIGQIPRVVQAQREAEFVRPAREMQERGNFGPVWRGYRGEAAIEKLLKERQGEVVGAMSDPRLGVNSSIDFVGGTEKYGLAHIEKKHGAEALTQIPRIIREGTPQSLINHRISYETDEGLVVLKNEWKGAKKNWILTSYLPGGIKKDSRSAQDTQIGGRTEESTSSSDGNLSDARISQSSNESNRDFSVRSDLSNSDVRSAWGESSWDLVSPHAETRSGVESSGGYNTVFDGKV